MRRQWHARDGDGMMTTLTTTMATQRKTTSTTIATAQWATKSTTTASVRQDTTTTTMATDTTRTTRRRKLDDERRGRWQLDLQKELWKEGEKVQNLLLLHPRQVDLQVLPLGHVIAELKHLEHKVSLTRCFVVFHPCSLHLDFCYVLVDLLLCPGKMIRIRRTDASG